MEDFKANQESPNRQNPKDDAEDLADFWSIQGDFIYLEFNSVPQEETFPRPLKYFDVTKSTHTDLDVMQEKRIDDYWNVDANRSLSDSWKGFTNFTPLKEEPPRGYMWSGERLAKIRTTTRPDHVCGLVCGPKLGKPLRIEKSKYGKTRSQNSTKLDD